MYFPGKSTCDRWQQKSKTTPRKQLQQLQQQANTVHPVSESSTQLHGYSSFSSGNQQLVVLKSALLPSKTSPPLNYLSVSHPKEFLQINPYPEQKNLSPLCILEGLTPSPSSEVTIPYLISSACSSSVNPKSFCTQSAVSIKNKSQQTHQFQYQQYCGIPSTSYQLEMFQPPPRERGKNLHSHDSSHDIISQNISRYNQSENSPSESQPLSVQSLKNFDLEIDSSTNANTVATIQSTWLSAQPLANVHLVMGLAAGNVLKKKDTTNKETYPTSTTRQSISGENPGKPHKLSQDSTSFDFTNEAAKMVSTLCNSNTMKETDTADHQNAETTKCEGRHVVSTKTEEINVSTNDKGSTQFKKTESKASSAMTVNNKDWILMNKSNSGDEESVNNDVNVSSLSLEDNENNTDDFELKLSPSSNSSCGTDNKSKEPIKSNVSCHTSDICDEQQKFCKTTVKGCDEINKIIQEFMSPSLEGLSQFCCEVQQSISKPKSLFLGESVQKELIVGFLRLANSWSDLLPVFGAVGGEVAHVYQDWTYASRKLMEEMIKIFEHQVTLNEEKCNSNTVAVATRHPNHHCVSTAPVYSTPSSIQQNHKPNRRVQRFSDTHAQVANSHNQSSIKSFKENNKRSNFIASSAVSSHSAYSNSQSDPQIHTGYKGKQKNNIAGKKALSPSNIEVQLQDKVVTKQWKEQQYKANKPSPVGKMIPLRQIATPQSSSQHSDLSSWFQSFSNSYPENTYKVLYTNELNHPTYMETPIILSQNIPEQSFIKSSFQPNCRKQVNSTKVNSWPNRKNNYHQNPSCNTARIALCDEQDSFSSDVVHDRTYIKTGSYDTPKKVTHNITPNTHNSASQSLTSVGVKMTAPFPATSIVSPPIRTLEMNPKIVRHKKDQSPTEISDALWKKACQSAGSLLETLQSSESVSLTSACDLNLEEIRKIVSGDQAGSENEEKAENNLEKNNIERKEMEVSKKHFSVKQKGSAVKTDHWLMHTLNSVSKLQNDSEIQSSHKTENEKLSLETASRNILTERCTSANSQGVQTVEISNTERLNQLKNTLNHKEYNKDDQTPKSRKPSNVKKHHHESKNNTDSRKRKLQERSPTEEQKVTEIPNKEAQNALGASSGNKPKPDIHNRSTWNVWYSSRKRRGLSPIAINKLENILNVIWNLESSDFVKYPVSSNDVSIVTLHFLQE